MRSLAVLAFLLAASAPAVALAAPAAPQHSLDHVLLWGRGLDRSTADLTVKLGFQVKPGRDPGGVGNRYIRLGDGNFIELLGFTRANPELDPGMDADQAVLKGQPGVRTFGIRSGTLEQDRQALLGRGFPVTPMFTAGANDPDGQGPGKPPRWRLFAFEKPVLSNNLFLIDYAARPRGAVADADDALMRQHPNGARALSAIWMLSGHADEDKAALAKLGYGGAVPVRMAAIGARGYCVPVGPTALLALEPDGAGIAQAALAHGGAQVLGVSLAVEDLGRTQRIVERGYETALKPYQGVLGTAILAPTQDDLGMLIEFHEGMAAACAAK